MDPHSSNSGWDSGCSVTQSYLTLCDLQHTRLPSASLSPGVCSTSCPLSQWCHPTISSSVILFSSCPQSFPGSKHRFFTSGGQSIVASALASVLPTNIQGWFPLDWLVWSAWCAQDSQKSSPAPQFESINSSAFSLLYGPVLTTTRDHWEDHSLDCRDLRWHSDASAFQHTV